LSLDISHFKIFPFFNSSKNPASYVNTINIYT